MTRKWSAELNTAKKSSGASLLFLLITALLLLTGIGLVALYSASYDKALRLGLSPEYFLKKQVLYSLAGIAAAVILYLIPERILKLLLPPALIISIILMLLTLFTSLGETQLGARRWIQLGPVGFQPSEVLKVAAILFLARYFEKHHERITWFSTIIFPTALVFFCGLLILIQRDFSTTVLFMAVMFLLIAVSGTRLTYLLFFLLFVGIPGILLLFTESYRIARVIGFIFPDIDPSGINYQVGNSLEAIRSGGLFGKGLGNGMYKLGSLPEVQSDFVFSSWVEETGLIGGLAVLVLFGLFGFAGYFGSARSMSGGGTLFLAFSGIGITSLILFQAIMNLGVVTGIVPPTGIPLPFFSQGGTSLFVNLAIGGLLCKAVAAEKQVSRNVETHRQGEHAAHTAPFSIDSNGEVFYEE